MVILLSPDRLVDVVQYSLGGIESFPDCLRFLFVVGLDARRKVEQIIEQQRVLG